MESEKSQCWVQTKQEEMNPNGEGLVSPNLSIVHTQLHFPLWVQPRSEAH